ncbi:response regulator transcription factor [Streptomyces longispororuber]|uniref:response regulator transcription factor n=1 Tax=Streptomyces longispororuber TaxID=68230 RepID=UPI00210EF03D|nr:response regulator transcription factor [Streptomyces longispororuber]MCQ4212339.1 response regulator transcription factor [Streptomyces longispororuber]
MRLLLVEDDDHEAGVISLFLVRHSFEVVHARSCREALEALTTEEPGFDLILVEPVLPDAADLEICGEIRKRTSMPFIIVTGRSGVRARIHGLNLGAADYVVKPYDASELIARINAVTRRTAARRTDGAAQTVLYRGPLIIDLPSRQVTINNSFVQLTPKEFDLLVQLAKHQGEVVTRERIMIDVWRTNGAESGNTLGTHIASLRSKLGAPALIRSVRGVGYRLVVP